MRAPEGDRCPIGPLQLHTWNYERSECIWCGPNALAWKPGHWVEVDSGLAWSADIATAHANST